ncbi:MAG: AI-2E family transporter [Clostridiales bacterium]|nr:AI-2E family transporter [Clostridiales bacterium]
MKKLEKYSNWIIALVFTVIVIAVYKTFDNFHKIAGGLRVVMGILTPFVIGFVIAYILNMPAKKINALCVKSKYKFIRDKAKVISILAVYLAGALLLFIIIRSIVPALYNNIMDLYYNIPHYFDDAVSAVADWQTKHDLSLFEVDKIDAANALNNLLGKINVAEFSKYAKGVVSITSGVINVFIGIIISVYMLIDKEKIKNSVQRVMRIFIKEERTNKIISGVKRINDVFSRYVFCLLMDAVIIAVLSTIVLSLLRVRYAIILGGLIGVCNLIPYFGAIFASVFSIIITLITGGLFKAIWTAVSLLMLQQVDGNFIGPKIMGQMLDASPLWIIFAVTVGGGLFGVAGMIISVPILVVIKMIVSDYINMKESKEKEIKNGDE